MTVTPTTIYIEQSAHCDWDWMVTFEQYYMNGLWAGSVKNILNGALCLLTKHAGATPPYVYAFCEAAYLRRHFGSDPQTLDPGFTVSSGGFTSAENLITHGEVFIRNYLLGRAWTKATLGIQPSDQLWIPDDFGHDAQLPIVVRAMGLMGVGFERVPGAWMTNTPPPPPPYPTPIAPLTLLAESGRDFLWMAADSSTIQAHWLDGGYGQVSSALQNSAATAIQTVIEAVSTNTHTTLLFAPADNDFMLPWDVYNSSCSAQDLLDLVNAWNSSDPPPAVNAILGTFDDYMKAIASTQRENLPLLQSNPRDGSVAFVPHPYWSGCYVSRIAIKQLQYATARDLLFAESIELFLEMLAAEQASWQPVASNARAAIADAWNALMPSTHHDYITGTSPDDTTNTDQLSLDPTAQWSLPYAHALAASARANVINSLAPALSSMDGATASVAVFNAQGFSRFSQLTAIPLPSETIMSSVSGVELDPVQITTIDDVPTLLFLGSAPALGFNTTALTQFAPTRAWFLELEEQPDGSYVMRNDAIAAVITTLGLVALFDRIADPNQQINLLNGVSNALQWFQDDGSLYEFGTEMLRNPPIEDPKFAPIATPNYNNATIKVVDDGPLLKQIVVTFTIDDPNTGNSQSFTQTYALVAGENLLRMTTTGTAPYGVVGPNPAQGYTVMTSFTFTFPVRSLLFGTPHHWDWREPRSFYQDWPPPSAQPITFEPTHGFVTPMNSNGDPIAAIYHASSPAWGIAPDGSLLGCLLRNTPNGRRGANGADNDQHTLAYAIRIPSGLQNVNVMQCESLAFNNPLSGVLVPNSGPSLLPTNMSLAATNNADAWITAAKCGTYNASDIILRLYQPSNAESGFSVEFDPRFRALFNTAQAITALEERNDDAIVAVLQPDALYVTTPFALGTVALSLVASCK